MPLSVPGFSRQLTDSSAYGTDKELDIRKLDGAPLGICAIQDKQNRYHVRKWIKVVLEKSEDCYVAKNETLYLFGEGKTESKAIDDLIGQIVYFYNFYQELDQSEVTADALEFKQLYAELLVKV